WNDPKMPIEDIELSYDALDGRFLKSVPLHHSQRILVDNDEEFRISLRLRITNDFVMELLSRSRSLTVIRPQSLRERVRKVYEEALKRNS
ncbi:MAG: WYL domain-containing protein, partial [Prevotella sp.]|nr:WYL domain-containing protein [Prevotella sp.]